MAHFSLEKNATLHFYQQGVTQPSSPLPRQPHNSQLCQSGQWKMESQSSVLLSSLNFGAPHTLAAHLYSLCDLLLVVFAYGSESVSCSVVSDSLWPHGPWPARLLCPRDSPGKSTGVGSHSLLQGTFLTQESNTSHLHCRWILYCLSHQGSPSRVL